jgi:hypothetical protein
MPRILRLAILPVLVIKAAADTLLQGFDVGI